MKTSKVVQLAFAGALALTLNGVAAAHPVHLNASATHSVAVTTSAHSPLIASSVGVLHSLPSVGKFYNHFCNPVPEPSVYLLMLAGVGLIGFMSYRRQHYLMSTGPVLSGA